MKIPKSVELALLKQRIEMNKQADIFNKHASKVNSMVVQPETLDVELQFWNIKNDDALDDFLLNLSSALMLAGGELDLNSLPEGYAPLIRMLDFELSCQNEGWLAFCNSGEEEMRSVIEAYRYLRLDDEAAALSFALQKYREVDDEDEEFHQLIGVAYGSVENKTPELEDRLTVVRNFVREHSQLFATTKQ